MGMMSDADMAALQNAQGTEAGRNARSVSSRTSSKACGDNVVSTAMAALTKSGWGTGPHGGVR